MKRTVETTPRLSVRQAPPRTTASTTFSVVLWPVADGVIRARIDWDDGRLDVRLAHPGAANVATRIAIGVIQHPCGFGGARLYFRCPGCDVSAEHLYLKQAALVCRICANLTYTSRLMRRRDRDLATAGSLRVQIGGTPSIGAQIPVRPRGMRRRTYAGIVHAIHVRERRALEVLTAKLRAWCA